MNWQESFASIRRSRYMRERFADSPKSVTESDSTTVNVELLGRNVENLLVGNSDGRESFVDLELGDLVDGDTCSLEGERNGVSRGDREVDRSAGSVGEGYREAN